MERDQASKFINDLLKLMVSRNGSDLFITAEFSARHQGRWQGDQGVASRSRPTTLTLARHHERQTGGRLRAHERCNFAISPVGIGRFRSTRFIQQGKVGMVLRTIPLTLPTIDSLGVPQVLKEVTMTKRGLCILVGATGSESTTLAAMVDWRNENSFGHHHRWKTPSNLCTRTGTAWSRSAKWAWTRQLGSRPEEHAAAGPDVILMGEIRDRETMEHAVAFAETGHLCLATLHANSANQALDRSSTSSPKSAAPSC